MVMFLDGPLLLVIVVAVLVILLIATAAQSRRYTAQTDQRLCRGCGTSHPNFAVYCRLCGKKMGDA